MDFDALVPHPLDESQEIGGMVINPHSAYGKELRKWEQHRTDLVPRGTNPGNPYVYRPYPKMLYRAQRMPNGQYACFMPTPQAHEYLTENEYGRAMILKDTFDRSCYAIVSDESAELLKRGQGWTEDPIMAMEQYEREQRAIGNASAEALHAAQRMSDKAQRELSAAGGETHEHVVDVKGGRKGPKSIAGSGEVEG